MLTTLPDTMQSVLAAGRQAYVAVPSRRGPHVTPELYAPFGDRLWFASATTTLKTRVLAARPSAGAVVSVPGRSVILRGPVTVFDPRRPIDLLRRAGALPAASQAMVRYGTRNAADLLAFLGDIATGKLGWWFPPPRAFFSLQPDAALLVENDVVTEVWGDWPSGTGPFGHDAPVPAGGEAAVVALPGPVPLPGRWFAESQRVHISPTLLERMRFGPSFDLGVVLDDYTAPGPAAKRGVLLRGRASLVADEPGMLAVSTDEEIEWAGTETVTTAGA